jgi:hypothetical protein
MRAFDEWWDIVLNGLDNGREIRNWTARNGFAISGKFLAISYRSLSADFQEKLTNGHLFQDPNAWIVCSQVTEQGVTKVSKKEFQDRYWKWIDYRNDGMTRKAFSGDGNASPYLISIFKEFDKEIA